MSNEEFFLTGLCDKFEWLENEEPTILENSIRVYYFTNYSPDGTSSIYKIRFNSIGGYIDCEEV
jgi:hypothetical protein